MDMNSNLVKLAVTLGALYAAYKFGPAWMKGLAIGAAGTIALNQIPVVRDGALVRVA